MERQIDVQIATDQLFQEVRSGLPATGTKVLNRLPSPFLLFCGRIRIRRLPSPSFFRNRIMAVYFSYFIDIKERSDD